MPLPSFFGQETGLQLPKTYGICDSALRSAQFQVLCPEKGAHKGRPYPIQVALRGCVPIWCNCPELRGDCRGEGQGERGGGGGGGVVGGSCWRRLKGQVAEGQ